MSKNNKILTKTVEHILNLKEMTRLYQLHLLNDFEHINKNTICIISALETLDTCDLVMTFIINRSPNTKIGITLLNKCCDTLKKQCINKNHDSVCKKEIRAINNTQDHLVKLSKLIK